MATILLLDDDAGFRTTTNELLAAQGHQVLACSRASEARSRLAVHKVDLLIVDYLLPDVDGVRFMKQLRIAGVQAPAVLVSHFLKQSDSELIKQGFTAVLHKPVPPATLLTKVQRLLGGAPMAIDPAGEKALDLLRASYVRDLPAQLDGLRSAVAQLRAKPAETALRGVVRRRAHQIAGTAGSFGYAHVGTACAQIEAALFTQSGIGWEKIDAALASISAAMAPQEAGSAAQQGSA